MRARSRRANRGTHLVDARALGAVVVEDVALGMINKGELGVG